MRATDSQGGTARLRAVPRSIITAGLIAISAVTVALAGPTRSIPQATQNQQITLQPTSGPPGTVVQVAGAEFGASPCGVNLYFDSLEGELLAFASIAGGAFSTQVSIPGDASPGEHSIVAQGLTSGGEFCSDPSTDQASASFRVTPSPDAPDFNIYLKTRIIASDCGIDPDFLAEIQASPREVTHGIVQLERLPRAVQGGTTALPDDIATLSALGVTLLQYLNANNGPGTAYLAAIARGVLATDPRFDELIRCLERLTPEDRRAPDLTPEGAVEILALFFGDVSPDAARAILQGHGLTGELFAPGLWRTTATPDQIAALTDEDAVQWVQSGPPPFMPTVDEVRDESGVDGVQDLDTGTGIYSGLNGAGVEIGIMDSGVDSQHNDFAGRFVRMQDDGGDHGSHVAGIAIGSGAQSALTNDAAVANGGTAFQWRGMAPGAGIAAYGQAGGNAGVFSDAINNFGVDVSNHSYVLQVQNQYDATVASVDTIVRGDSPGIPARPLAWAAANNASVGPRDCTGDGVPDGNFPQYPGGCPAGFQAGYFSILSPCKNCIDVGSLDKDLVHSGFSSMGPTSDGRLKPDLAILGAGIRSVGANTDGDGNPVTGNGYRNKSGTSMASPAVAGIVALMLEQYATTNGVNIDVAPPLPSTLKAVLVQSAVDLNDTDPTTNFDTGAAVSYGDGPDWATGYGLADAPEAVRIIADNGFLEDQVSLLDVTDDHPVTVVPGQTVIRVTLAWDDRAGTPNANDATPQLVNDLDLTLIDPAAGVHRPLVLPTLTPRDCDGVALNGVQVGTCPGQDNAAQNYFGPAAAGTDRRNNVEQVVLENPGGLLVGGWTARVSVLNADGVTVRMPLGGTQPYSLVTEQPNVAPVAVCAAGPVVQQADGDCCVDVTDVDVDGGSFDPNGDGDIASLCITNADGDPVVCGTPAELCGTGAHLVTLTITDTAGESDTCQATVVVEDVTPPVITCPLDEVLECPADTTPGNTGTATATDNCSVPAITFGDVSVPGCGGTETITRTWTATDDALNEASCQQTIEVVDTTPPEVFCSVEKSRLWPPNHKLVDVGLVQEAVDACDPAAPAIEISVTSDEHPADELGSGGPKHCPDAVIGEDGSVKLRAERSGRGDGRVYQIQVAATDACGNVGICTEAVAVPKSMGLGKATVVDSGQDFDPEVCEGAELALNRTPARRGETERKEGRGR